MKLYNVLYFEDVSNTTLIIILLRKMILNIYDGTLKNYLTSRLDGTITYDSSGFIGNPINYSDGNGNWPSWATKLCIGLAVIAVCAIVAVACVATGGAAACIATSMLVGAVKGALIGKEQ